MTDYCELEDVYPLISAIGMLTDASQLTAAGAEMLISQVGAEIDGHLRAAGYVLPVTGATPLATLTAVCQSGSAARILRSLFPATEGVSGERGAAVAHERAYRDGLDLIDRGGLAADLVPAAGGRVRHGFHHRHPHEHHGCEF